MEAHRPLLRRSNRKREAIVTSKSTQWSLTFITPRISFALLRESQRVVETRRHLHDIVLFLRRLRTLIGPKIHRYLYRLLMNLPIFRIWVMDAELAILILPKWKHNALWRNSEGMQRSQSDVSYLMFLELLDQLGRCFFIIGSMP